MNRFATCTAIVLGLTIQMFGITSYAEPGAPSAEYINYTVQTGDTLISIADKQLQSRQDWVDVQKINQLNNTRRLQPQSVIKLPYERLRFVPLSAKVIGLVGQATFTRTGKSTPLSMNTVLLENDMVRTSANTFVTLELIDGSRLSMPSNTEMQIARLRKVAINNQPITKIQVNRGSIESQVAPQTGPSRFEVRSPMAIAGVRGTHFRVGVNESGDKTASEVLEGSIAVKGNAVADNAPEKLLPEKFGNLTDKLGKVGEAIALLPPPTLQDPGKVQDEKLITFNYAPNADIKYWVAKVSKDAGFTETLLETKTPEPQTVLQELPDGNYFIKLSAIDKNGLEGLTKTYTFSRRLNLLGGNAVTSSGNEFSFAWSGKQGAEYRFQLSKDDKFTTSFVDVKNIHSSQLNVSNLSPGTYYWRVISTSMIDGQLVEKATKPSMFDVVAPHAH